MSPPESAATTALVSFSFAFLPSPNVCEAARPRRRSTRQLFHPSWHLSPRACNVGTFEVLSLLSNANVDVDLRSISHLVLLLLLLLHVRLNRLGFSFVSMHPSSFVSLHESKPRRTTSTSLLLRFGRGCDQQGYFHDERTIVKDKRRLPTRRKDGFANQRRVDELLLRQQRSKHLQLHSLRTTKQQLAKLEDGSFASFARRLFFRSREAGRTAVVFVVEQQMEMRRRMVTKRRRSSSGKRSSPSCLSHSNAIDVNKCRMYGLLMDFPCVVWRSFEETLSAGCRRRVSSASEEANVRLARSKVLLASSALFSRELLHRLVRASNPPCRPILGFSSIWQARLRRN